MEQFRPGNNSGKPKTHILSFHFLTSPFFFGCLCASLIACLEKKSLEAKEDFDEKCAELLALREELKAQLEGKTDEEKQELRAELAKIKSNPSILKTINEGWESNSESDLGLDAKFVWDDRIVLDLTLNPDFSQIESDEPQIVSNERFEVFFPEKRPFFIENADYFSTPLNLLFTRKI